MNRDLPTAPHSPSRPRKWLRRMVACFLLFCATLALINGPIARWAIPRIARHYAAKSGLELKLRVSGNLSHGLALHDLSAIGGPIKTLRIDLIAPQYHWRDAMKGKVAGLKIEGLLVQYDLEKSFAHSEKKPSSTAFSLEEIFQPLRQGSVTLRPYDLHVQADQLEILRGATSLLQIHQLNLDHSAGSDDWSIRSQAQQVPSLPPLPPQQTVLRWTDRELSLERWKVRPDLRIENLLLRYPQSAMPSVDANIVIADSTWNIRSSIESRQCAVRLVKGTLSTAVLENLVGFTAPLRAEIDRCELLAEWPSFSPADPDSWSSADIDGSLQLSATQITDAPARSWLVDRSTLQLRKKSQQLEVVLTSSAYGAEAEFSLTGTWPQAPKKPSDFSNINISYRGQMTKVDSLLRQTLPRWSNQSLSPDHPIPTMALEWQGSLQVQDRSPRNITGQARIDLLDPNHTDLALRFDGDTLDAWNFSLETPGMQLMGRYRRSTQEYQSSLRCQQFDIASWRPHLAWLGMDLPNLSAIDLQAKGSGQLRDSLHEGSISWENLTWQRTAETVQTKGQVDYQWPSSLRLSNIQVQLDNQQLRLDAAYQDSLLSITKLEHRENDQTLLEGTAEIPLDMEVRSLPEFWQQDRAWNCRIQSKKLPISMINRWLPAASPLPISGTAEVSLRLEGSPAQPQLSLETRMENIRHRNQPAGPAAEFHASLTNRAQELLFEGEISTERLAPLTLRASMPFRPKEWSEDPSTWMAESMNAELTLPPSNLAEWQSLVPSLAQLQGKARGRITASGPLSQPLFDGEFSISECSASPIEKTIPPWRDGTLRLRFHDRTAQLEQLSLELAGGSLQATGRADFPKDQTPQLDFQLVGKELPLWRSSAIISRANAQLALRGAIDAAKITGAIDVVDSMLYKDFEIIPIGRPFSLAQAAELPALDRQVDAATSAVPEPFDRWELDVAVRTADPFLIRGNLARGEIQLDARLRGTIADPRPSGKAELRELLAALPLSRLHVEKGEARFVESQGMDPNLDIRGYSRVSNYDINIYVYGPSSAPKILLSSTPPLPDHEIMTLLATGTTTKGLSDGSMAQSRALQLLVEEFRRGRLPLGRRLAPFLERIDDVELAVGQPDPYSGRKRSSIQLPFAQYWSLFGGVDGEGKTRNLLLFEVKFR